MSADFPRGRYWSPSMANFPRTFQSTLPVAFSGTMVAWGTRCPCQQCSAHDFRLITEVEENAARRRLEYSRRTNYLEPYIRRMDHHIERLRKLAG